MDFSDFFYTATDGLRLHARVYGEALPGRAVVCLPGLTRNARDFHALALYLSKHAATPRRVVAFDYRGRGLSAADPDPGRYTVAIECADVLAGLDALAIAQAAFIGTSRGGLILHVMTGLRRDAIKAVVFNDIGPALEVAGLLHISGYLKNARPINSFEDAVAVQKEIHGADFAALSQADWRRQTAAILREGVTPPVSDFDPALRNSLDGLDPEKPLPTLWPQFEAMADIPVMVVRGANSRLLSAATLEEMRRRHPRLEAITVEGQGHPPLLETGNLPQRTADFFDRAGV